MLPYLILGTTYAFAAAVQPGQFQAYLISQSLANGWRRTLPAAFAPILSDVPIVSLVLLVLTRVPPMFVYLLQLAGGLFILYLAAGAFKAWRDDRQAAGESAASPHQTVIKAAVVNLLNPNPYLAWALVLGPLLLKAWRETPANAAALIVAFYATLILATAGIIILFASARSFGPRVVRLLVGVSALALAAFGLYQLWSGTTAVLHHAQLIAVTSLAPGSYARGLRHSRPGKRAKSESELQIVRPCSIASAARWASGTRLPVAWTCPRIRPRTSA